MMDVDRVAVSLAKAEDVPQCILIDKDRGFEAVDHIADIGNMNRKNLGAKRSTRDDE